MATAQDTTVGPGIFITFEGGDGAGKTTHITFLAERLRKMGYEVLCLREPGGTAIGEALRSIVLNPENSAMSDQAELLIYEAARAQIVKETIIPALARGAVVLLDRFYDSTVAYQAYGRGLPVSFVHQANVFACQGVHPCRTILLTTEAPAEEGLERATHHGDADRLEQAGADFHARVNSAFMRIAAETPNAFASFPLRVPRTKRLEPSSGSFPIYSAGMLPALCGSLVSSKPSLNAIPTKKPRST